MFQQSLPCLLYLHIPYSRKYWWELNLAIGSHIAIANDLNLAVRYGIAIRIYANKKFWQILIWQFLMPTAKLPNFPAIQYIMTYMYVVTKIIDVVTTSTQATPIHYAFLIHGTDA